MPRAFTAVVAKYQVGSRRQRKRHRKSQNTCKNIVKERKQTPVDEHLCKLLVVVVARRKKLAQYADAVRNEPLSIRISTSLLLLLWIWCLLMPGLVTNADIILEPILL